MGTSSPPPTVSDPTTNSLSDLSCSSGPSHTSTRNTSPDSVVAVSPSHRASSPLSLNLLSIDIDHTSPNNNLLDCHPKMDRNPFHSVNERRNKLSTDRNSSLQINQLPQSSSSLQPTIPRPNMQPISIPSRGLSSSNWRSAEEGTANCTNDMMAFDAPVGQHSRHGSMAARSSYMVPMMDQYPAHHQLLSYPEQVIYSEAQLDSSFAYCYDRGNGQYTRLVPADRLPALKDIPAIQHNTSGMMVLPQPRATPPEGLNGELVMLNRSPDASCSSSSDNIQSRIDTIVASTPPTPTHLQSPMSPVGVAGLGPGSTATNGHHHSHHPTHQHHGGSHSHTHNHGGGGNHNQQQQREQQPQRRPKVYCDKWVHEGVCAFTQQGCKYKHEMPFDKMTQHQLGLFHGFPAWWKKHQADLSRQRDVVPAVEEQQPSRLSSDRFVGRNGGHGHSSTSSVTATPAPGGTNNGDPGDMGPGPAGQSISNWRRNGNGESHRPSMVAGRGVSHRAGTSMRTPILPYGSPFGPIAPPIRHSTATPGAYPANMVDASYAGPSQSQYMGEARKSTKSGAGIPTANPYESLAMESLSMENGNDNGSGHVEARTPVAVAANSSNGARLN